MCQSRPNALTPAKSTTRSNAHTYSSPPCSHHANRCVPQVRARACIRAPTSHASHASQCPCLLVAHTAHWCSSEQQQRQQQTAGAASTPPHPSQAPRARHARSPGAGLAAQALALHHAPPPPRTPHHPGAQARGTPARQALASPLRPPAPAARGVDLSCDAASMQFFKGVAESSVPEVQLLRSRTGTSGSAKIVFDNPSLFQASSEMGEITGLYMVDDEVRTSTCAGWGGVGARLRARVSTAGDGAPSPAKPFIAPHAQALCCPQSLQSAAGRASRAAPSSHSRLFPHALHAACMHRESSAPRT